MKEKLPAICHTYHTLLPIYSLSNAKVLPLKTKKPHRLVRDQWGFLTTKLLTLESLCLSFQFVNCQRIKNLLRKKWRLSPWTDVTHHFPIDITKAVSWSTFKWWDWRIYTQCTPLIVMAISIDWRMCSALSALPAHVQVFTCNHLNINAQLPLSKKSHLITWW